MYDDQTQGDLGFRLDKARGISSDPLDISKNAPTQVQAFFFSQIKRLNDYVRESWSNVKGFDMTKSNVGRFFSELVRFRFGRFEIISINYEKEEIILKNYVDAGYLISLFESHVIIFKFMDTVEIQPKQWAVVECDKRDVQLLIFASSTYTTETIVDRLKRAVNYGKTQGWNGRLFYTRCDDVVNIEIK